MATTPKEVASVSKVFVDINYPASNYNLLKQTVELLKANGWSFSETAQTAENKG